MGEAIASVEQLRSRRAADALEAALIEHCAVHFQRKDAQRAAVAAFGVAAAARAIQRRDADAPRLSRARAALRRTGRAVPAEVAEGAGVGRRDARAPDCGSRSRRHCPVDAAVLGLAAAEIAAVRRSCGMRGAVPASSAGRCASSAISAAPSPCRRPRTRCRLAESAPRAGRRCRRRPACSTM